ncbi:D-beta-hydroxybutyrate dehydrogenase, mitochondrial-like [Lingula anatina]|uniref:D-beta-hydroxybutyrate dehydrogenase, mitochondrial-like n=1 Tax=Lingula anatina TaxID=7574 RepID=A0A1S3HT98_LINAN|nr:D-beta-hydroxybutyrate dehydrogenase, mitochondrial-like [Lingula anatina]|eukprot:XP_013389265.1 D-beta-hydroxybutyrate dehydrogenase, mitochondrial-like [Lingula anatina]
MLIMDSEESALDDDFLLYSVLYSSITVVFAMAVLSKFLTNEFRFGIRSVLTLAILFIGEPLCQFLMKGPQGVMAFGLGCLLVYSLLPSGHLPATKKAVLITGCDSGFGHALAKKLDSIGMNVFAACLDSKGPGALHLKNTTSTRLKIVQLDVTKEEEIHSCLQYVEGNLNRAGDPPGLWGLVNNAGTASLGEIDMTDIRQFQKLMEVNFFGTVRMTKAFLPLLRQAGGRVVNVSSMADQLPTPFFGAYSASKHAIKGFTETLRHEMKKWNIQVSLIEPSGFCTGATTEDSINTVQRQTWEQMDRHTRERYGEEYYNQLFANYRHFILNFSKDLSPVVRAMRSGLLSKRPRERYPCGRGAETILTLFGILPIWMSDKIIQTFGLGVKNIKPRVLS